MVMQTSIRNLYFIRLDIAISFAQENIIAESKYRGPCWVKAITNQKFGHDWKRGIKHCISAMN